jgi:hypothetical protein
MRLGSSGTPTFASMTITGLTASSLVGTNASKLLESVTIGSSLDYTRPTLDTIQDIQVTASPTWVGLTLSGKVTSGSFASPIDVTNTREYGVELHYSGNNYNVTGIRSRARLKTTDTTATVQGALLQAANENGIDAGVLNGALIEAIGKSDGNAATIAVMRGALVNTEWGDYDTVTNLKTLHVRTHSRNAAGAGSFGTGYGIYIENEAVGGNGQAWDAGIYFKGTNLSAGNKAFTYGIDFSGGTYGTAEMLIGNATIASLGNSLIIQPITDTVDFWRINDKDGNVIASCDTVNNRWGFGTAGPQEIFHILGSGTTRLEIESSDGSSAVLKLTNTEGGHAIYTDGGALHFYDYGGVIERAVIDTAGKFGLGVESPLGVLHCKGNPGEYIFSRATDNTLSTDYVVIRLVSGSNAGAGFYLTNDFANPTTSANSAFGMFSKANHAEHVFFVADCVGNQFVFTNIANRLLSHDHSAQTNPTLYIHSDKSPNTDNTEWLSLTHDQTNAIISWGSGALEFQQASPYIQLHNSTHEDTDGGGESRLIFKREDSDGAETACFQFEASHDGSGVEDQFGKGVWSVNTGAGLVGAFEIQSTTDWVINKTSGVGIKVDLANPTFGWADLLGDQFAKNTGGTKPTLVAYNSEIPGTSIDAWQFSDGDEAFLSFHIPHDYVPGTDIYLHIHWSQNNVGATGGTIDFKYFAIYAKGHNQVSGSAFTSTPITATFSSIDIDDSGSGGSGLAQYQQHITEVIISGASATVALFDRDDFEPDGVIELTFEMDANNLTGTPSDPFIHYIDIHYQTTAIIGTKDKAPDFYT